MERRGLPEDESRPLRDVYDKAIPEFIAACVNEVRDWFDADRQLHSMRREPFDVGSLGRPQLLLDPLNAKKEDDVDGLFVKIHESKIDQG